MYIRKSFLMSLTYEFEYIDRGGLGLQSLRLLRREQTPVFFSNQKHDILIPSPKFFQVSQLLCGPLIWCLE